MSPILDLQMRLRQLGTCRHGELVTRNGKTYPAARDTWRITTSDQRIALQIADMFGGQVKEWDSKSPEKYVVDTDAHRLPIAVVPGHALTQWYELWSGGGCKRRCDGHEELLTGGPCLCDPEARECKPHTRFSFVIRGVDALGLFRLNTSGYYAAVELAGAVQFLEHATAHGEILPGSICLEERKVLRDGQTKVFKVPVLDIEYGTDRLLPTSTAQAALSAPQGHTPLALVPNTVSVQDGLEAANRQAEPKAANARSAAPIGATADFTTDAPIPVPDDGFVSVEQSALPPVGAADTTAAAPASPPSEAAAPTTDEPKLATVPQKKKLNVLVGQLRDHGHLTTSGLLGAIGRHRQCDWQEIAVQATLDDGQLHWSPIRETLTRAEAMWLIDQLEDLQQKRGAA